MCFWYIHLNILCNFPSIQIKVSIKQGISLYVGKEHFNCTIKKLSWFYLKCCNLCPPCPFGSNDPYHHNHLISFLCHPPWRFNTPLFYFYSSFRFSWRTSPKYSFLGWVLKSISPQSLLLSSPKTNDIIFVHVITPRVWSVDLLPSSYLSAWHYDHQNTCDVCLKNDIFMLSKDRNEPGLSRAWI